MCRKIQETLKYSPALQQLLQWAWPPFKSDIKQNGFGSINCGPSSEKERKINLWLGPAGRHMINPMQYLRHSMGCDYPLISVTTFFFFLLLNLYIYIFFQNFLFKCWDWKFIYLFLTLNLSHQEKLHIHVISILIRKCTCASKILVPRGVKSVVGMGDLIFVILASVGVLLPLPIDNKKNLHLNMFVVKFLKPTM